MLCVMLSKFVKKCPSAVFAVLDDLVDPLLKTITFRPKPCSGKQKCDRNDKIIHGTLTAIASLDCTCWRDYSWKFETLVSEIAKTQKLREQYFSILDRSGSINCTSRFKNMVTALGKQENEVGPSQTYKPREERSVKPDKPKHIDEQGRRRSDRIPRQSVLLRDFVTHF